MHPGPLPSPPPGPFRDPPRVPVPGPPVGPVLHRGPAPDPGPAAHPGPAGPYPGARGGPPSPVPRPTQEPPPRVRPFVAAVEVLLAVALGTVAVWAWQRGVVTTDTTGIPLDRVDGRWWALAAAAATAAGVALLDAGRRALLAVAPGTGGPPAGPGHWSV